MTQRFEVVPELPELQKDVGGLEEYKPEFTEDGCKLIAFLSEHFHMIPRTELARAETFPARQNDMRNETSNRALAKAVLSAGQMKETT